MALVIMDITGVQISCWYCEYTVYGIYGFLWFEFIQSEDSWAEKPEDGYMSELRCYEESDYWSTLMCSVTRKIHCYYIISISE